MTREDVSCKLTHKSVTLLCPASVLQHCVLPLVLETRRKLDQPTAQRHIQRGKLASSTSDTYVGLLSKLHLLPPPMRSGRLVCVQPHAKRYVLNYMKFLPKVGPGPVSRWIHFGGDLEAHFKVISPVKNVPREMSALAKVCALWVLSSSTLLWICCTACCTTNSNIVVVHFIDRNDTACSD